MLTYVNGLNQIARQANWLEMNGNSKGSNRLRVMLGEHHCCSACGASQSFNPPYYHHSGFWRCPLCDGPLWGVPMIVIRRIDDLRILEQNDSLPKWYLDHLYEFFILLFTASNQEMSLEAFSLEGFAEFVVLEPMDELHELRLPMIPSSPKLIEMWPEYVGKLTVEEYDVYRIMLMPDNERTVFIFSEVGECSKEVETWLAEQYAWSEVTTSSKEP